MRGTKISSVVVIMEPLVNSRSPQAIACKAFPREFNSEPHTSQEQLRILETRFPKVFFFFFEAAKLFPQEGYQYFPEKMPGQGEGSGSAFPVRDLEWKRLSSGEMTPGSC